MREKSNLEILTENREAVLDFVSNSLGGETLIVDTSYDDVKDSVERGNLTAALSKLDQLKDQQLGIKWHESMDLGTGTKVLVRDGRDVDPNSPLVTSEAGEKYAMQILNETRGAMLLLDQKYPEESPEKEKAKEKLMHLANKLVKDEASIKNANNDIKKYNTVIVNILEEAKIDEPAKALLFAKEFGNFDDEHKHIATLSSVSKDGTRHTVIEADIMLSGLTPEQKKQYQAIAALQDVNEKAVVDGKEVAWFNKLPEYKRKLIKDVSAEVAVGKKVLPTQLLKDIAGLRNAYQKITAVKMGAETPRILSQTFHCGAPASGHEDGKAAQDIANENIRQLQSFMPDGEKINLHILNTKIPLASKNFGENVIFSQMKSAKETLGSNISFTAAPVNVLRFLGALGGKSYKSFLSTIGNIAKCNDVKTQFPAVAAYLDNKKANAFIEFFTGRNEKLKKAALEALGNDDSPLSKDLRTAMEAKKLMEISSRGELRSPNNIGLDVTQKMNTLENSIKFGGALGAAGVTCPTRVDFCKSGKDRTGYVETRNTHEAICNFLGIDVASPEAKQFLKMQVASGHTQEMAGVQGGTLGCHGIKAVIAKVDQAAIGGSLDQASSEFNNSIKILKGKKAKLALKSFDESYAVSVSASTSATVAPAVIAVAPITVAPALASVQVQAVDQASTLQSMTQDLSKEVQSIAKDMVACESGRQRRDSIVRATKPPVERSH